MGCVLYSNPPLQEKGVSSLFTVKTKQCTCYLEEDGVLQGEAARLLLGRMQLLEQTDELFIRDRCWQYGDMLVSPFSLHLGFPSSFLPSWHPPGTRSLIFSPPFCLILMMIERKEQS